MSIPHFAANGCVHETMPLVLWTTLLRLLNLANSIGPGGNKVDGERGIVEGELLSMDRQSFFFFFFFFVSFAWPLVK